MPDLPHQAIVDDFVGNAHGNFARVKELLDQYPALVNAVASWNETALAAAAQTGQVQIAKMLLAAGAPMEICTAAMLGLRDRVADYLKADPGAANATGAHGIPVLYHAVIRGHAEIAEMLLAHGADVNANEGGNPPIHGATMFGQTEMVGWLLDRGANANALDYENKTPLRRALDANQQTLADLLRARGGKE